MKNLKEEAVVLYEDEDMRIVGYPNEKKEYNCDCGVHVETRIGTDALGKPTWRIDTNWTADKTLTGRVLWNLAGIIYKQKQSHIRTEKAIMIMAEDQQ